MEKLFIYFPNNKIYHKLESTNQNEIINFLSNFFNKIENLNSDQLLFIQVNNNAEIFMRLLLKVYTLMNMSNENKVTLKILLNARNLEIDCVVPIDENSIYMNLNIISANEDTKCKTFLNEKLPSNFTKMFLIKNLCIIHTKHDFYLEKIFTEKLKFQKEMNLEEFLFKIKIEKSKLQSNNKLCKSGDSKLPKKAFKMTKFHQYELVSKFTTNNMISKINELNEENSDEDEESVEEFDKISIDKNNEFKMEEFLYWIFIESLEYFENLSKYLNKEGEELKETYLNLQMKPERKKFYSKMSNLECTMHLLWQELKIKQELFSIMLKKNLKSDFQFKNSLTFYFREDERRVLKFAKNLTLYLEQMNGKIKETKFILKNLETSLQMIKKTFRILLDDSKRVSDFKLNKNMLFLTIISTLLISMQIIYTTFSMNVRLPIDPDSDFPFYFIVIASFIIFLGQFYILRNWKW